MMRFTSDTILTTVFRGLQLVVGFFTYAVIARVLGPENNGIYSLAILLPTLLMIFTDIGFTSAIVFYIGIAKYPLKEIFGSSIILSVLTSILSLIIGILLILYFGNTFFPGVDQIYLFGVLSLIPFKIFLNIAINILLGLQKIKSYNLVQFINATGFLILVLIFLACLQFNIHLAIFAELTALLIASMLLFIKIKKEVGGIMFSINKPLFKDFFSYGAKSYFGGISNFLHLKIGLWMINGFLNPFAAGIYSVAAILAEKIQVVSQPSSLVLFPRVASEREEKRLKEFTPLVLRNVLFLSFLAVIVFFVFSNWLITFFYSEQYADSVLPFQILLIGTIMFSGYRIILYDLAGRGRPIINTIVSIASLALNVILNIIFIPKLGIAGAAWATAISYTFAFLASIIFYIKISNNNIKNMIFITKTDLRLYVRGLAYLRDKFFR